MSAGETREAAAAADSGWIVWFDRLLDVADELAAVLLAAAAIITAMGMAGWTRGRIVDPWVQALWRWMGLGALLIPVLLALAAVVLGRRTLGRPTAIRWWRVIALEFALFSTLGLLALAAGLSLTASEAGWGGGLIGWGIATLLSDALGRIGAGLVLSVAATSAAGYALVDALRRRGSLREAVNRIAEAEARQMEVEAAEEPSARERRASRSRGGRLPKEYRKNFEVHPTAEETPAGPIARDTQLPSLSILDSGGATRITATEINRTAGLIEKTLADFGIPARVVDYRSGPSVTQYAVEPGYVEQTGSNGEVRKAKVRVSQISALSNDLALALEAPRLRIEAPVPGRPYVGIEVPNRQGAVVRLRPILESEAFNAIESPLTIALGRDVAGQSFAADLAAMPHLLIGGTTGSGKSVAITAIATCLAMNNSPDELRLVMVDPKMVELLRFNGLPHLFGKVETDLERIVGVLRWCTLEMDRRYRLMEEARARDIGAYNRKAARRRGLERMPRVVVMLDELADLMMMAPDQTERTLVRLAQMARAVGIHLIVATQRPSTDIVTGLIKANFPARIAFATASSTDSRVILDTQGAETLLGNGDMLYLAAEASAPVRLQGVYASDEEVARLIEFWSQEVDEVVSDDEPPWADHLARQETLEEHDDMLEQAIEVVRQEGEASASLLQRRLRVGYPRAARLMDELEELGVVGRPQSGGKTRDVLISDHEDPLLPENEDEDNEKP